MPLLSASLRQCPRSLFRVAIILNINYGTDSGGRLGSVEVIRVAFAHLDSSEHAGSCKAIVIEYVVVELSIMRDAPFLI